MRWFNSLGEMKVPLIVFHPFIYICHVHTHRHSHCLLIISRKQRLRSELPLVSPSSSINTVLINREYASKENTLIHPGVLVLLPGVEFYEQHHWNTARSLTGTRRKLLHIFSPSPNLWQKSWWTFATRMKPNLMEVISHQPLKICILLLKWDNWFIYYLIRPMNHGALGKQATLELLYRGSNQEQVSLRFLSSWIQTAQMKYEEIKVWRWE